LSSDLTAQPCGLKIFFILDRQAKVSIRTPVHFSSGDSTRIDYVDDGNEKWASFEGGTLNSSVLLQIILSNMVSKLFLLEHLR